MTKWRRDWAVFDILVLGLGVVLSAAYYVYRTLNPDLTSPLFDLWSNTAAGIVGAWIGVRIFDALIEARAKRHEVRRTIIRNLNYLHNEIQKLLPRFYDWNIVILQGELKWMKERMKNRSRYLVGDEETHLHEIVARLTDFIVHATAYQKHDFLVDRTWDNAEDMVEEVSKQRDAINREIDHSASAQDGLSSLEGIISKYYHYFSESEIKQITNFISPEKSGQDRPAYPRFERIYFHEFVWLRKIRREYRYLRDTRQFDNRHLIEMLHSPSILEEVNALPPLLADTFMKLLNTLGEFIEQAAQLETDVAALTQLIEKARFDIMEESEID